MELTGNKFIVQDRILKKYSNSISFYQYVCADLNDRWNHLKCGPICHSVTAKLPMNSSASWLNSVTVKIWCVIDYIEMERGFNEEGVGYFEILLCWSLHVLVLNFILWEAKMFIWVSRRNKVDNIFDNTPQLGFFKGW